MSRYYFDLSELAATAKANGYTVHLHTEADGSDVLSVGNSCAGPREFSSYEDAMKFAAKSLGRSASIAEYRHPENAGITFKPELLALVCWNEGKSVTVPLGPLGAIELGKALAQVGKELEGRFNE